MAVDSQTVIARDTEPVVATVDDEIVMLSNSAEAYFGLGKVGSEIWKLIERPRRVSDICAALGEVFDIDPQTCLQEVSTFLDSMLEHGLIRIVADGEATTP